MDNWHREIMVIREYEDADTKLDIVDNDESLQAILNEATDCSVTFEYGEKLIADIKEITGGRLSVTINGDNWRNRRI